MASMRSTPDPSAAIEMVTLASSRQPVSTSTSAPRLTTAIRDTCRLRYLPTIAPAPSRFLRRPVSVFAGLAFLLLALPYGLRLVVFPRTPAGEGRAASYLSLCATALIFAIAALGLALLVGYTRPLSLGPVHFPIFGG